MIMGLDHTANSRIPFCKALFFVGGVFIYFRWSICHVPYFQMPLAGAFSAGCHFCLVCLMVLLLFVIDSYVHEEYSLGLSNCNFFTVLPVV